MSISGKYVIAGIGQTKFGSLPGRSTISMNVEAIRNALADAGVEKHRVNAVLVKPPTSARESMYAHKLAEAIGLQPNVCFSMDAGGSSNIALITYAAMAIEHGQCDIALVCYADNPKSGSRAVYEQSRGGHDDFGWRGVPASYAMIARRHMEEFGTTEEQFGSYVVTVREHGAANPAAQLRKPLTLAEYLASPMMVDPFRRDDCALISDGGAAVVVMSEDLARDLQVRAPVPILGFGHGHSAWDVHLREDLTTTAAVVAGATAFKMAGLQPSDIDVAQIYDCFTITPMMIIEDYGFCKKGDSGRFIEHEGIGVDGRLPMNTSGGLLSETGMPGLQMVLEGVRQIRGNSFRQVKHAKKCIVANQGGIMQSHAAMILGQ